MYQIHTKHFSQLTAGELHRVVEAREAVFFLEQHITESDADDVDLQSTFLWMEDAGRVVAFLRIIPAGVVYKEVSIGRVLVETHHRHLGLCRQLMDAALQYIAHTWGAQPIRISAQKYLANFYATLGFEVISDTYLEAGLEHVKMLRK